MSEENNPKKSTKYNVNIGGKAKENKKEYVFRNLKCPGSNVKCFMGNAPRKGEWYKDTIKEHCFADNSHIMLTESEAKHLRERGIEKPIVTQDQHGNKTFSGQTYLDRRFDVYEA